MLAPTVSACAFTHLEFLALQLLREILGFHSMGNDTSPLSLRLDAALAHIHFISSEYASGTRQVSTACMVAHACTNLLGRQRAAPPITTKSHLWHCSCHSHAWCT